MKSFFTIGMLMSLAIFMSTDPAAAQNRGDGVRPSPNAGVTQAIGDAEVSVTYGRPGLKGRSLESLAPAGKVWRTGANESAAITFSSDVMLGGEEIKAGTYSLYSIPGDSWTFIINKKLSWGTQYDEAQDVVRVEAAVTDTDAPNMEWFTIYFDALSDTKAHLNLHWGTTKAAVPITIE